ncbi:hypothetical protein HPB50_003621 [Hyalomma asiaticum]|uniref:Uncharacterized protein n=1 Tax=Hyalomma asiaticum TaxID=266040 RepID=A0ACB7RH23_HYAAI|nr:hypothetical protein HPB50_003621 [Hyalomma asiaticum]
MYGKESYPRCWILPPLPNALRCCSSTDAIPCSGTPSPQGEGWCHTHLKEKERPYSSTTDDLNVCQEDTRCLAYRPRTNDELER